MGKKNSVDGFFGITKSGSSIKTEIFAGLTTFMTMAYVLVLNPTFMADAGMDWGKAFSATVISSIIACLVMGLYAKLPFALGPSVGISAFFAYTVCVGMGYSWKFGLTVVFTEGVLFLLMSIFKVREAIVDSVPLFLKNAISVGIGFFVAFIGLKNAGIVVSNEANFVALSHEWLSGSSLVAIIGLLITGVLMIKKVKGAFLLGMLITTVIGIPFGVTTYSGGSFLPTSPYFCAFSFKEIFADSKSVTDFLAITFVFLFNDMFNTVGTLIGCAGKSDMIDENGSIPNCGRALFADAVGTTVGAIFGTSTITTFVESSAGIVAGGRTGLTAIVTAVFFGLSMFLSPIFSSIPSAATSPILILVGVLMMEPIKDIDFVSDMSEAISAFLTILVMVCSSDIANGIMFGTISYVLLKLFSGRGKEINKLVWVSFGIFVLNAIISVIV